MAAEPSPRAVSDDTAAAHMMKLTCSHGGGLVPGPDGAAPRYVGGATRVLAVPRAASFRDLVARLSSEMAGGAKVRAVMHRLADDAGLEDVLVSVTCDDELAHMRDEYDRLRATRPNAAFRVFIDTITSPAPASVAHHHHQQQRAAASGGLPPLAPSSRTMMRRALSDEAIAASAHLRLYRRHAYFPVPVRRVQSAQELARARLVQPSPSFHPRAHQCQYDFTCHRQVARAPAPAPPPPAAFAVPYMPRRNVGGVPSVVAAEAKGRSRDGNESTIMVENRRAIWEFE